MPNYLLEGQTTERLFFRKLTPEDFKDWLPFYDNPASTQYWNGLPTDPSTACKEQFKRIFERYELGIGGMNALISKKDNRLIGMCGLLIQQVDNSEELEIGYSVLPKFWRQGYAFEAAKKCKDFAFEHRLRDSLISIIQVDNIPSQRTAIKNGMRLDKTTTYKNNRVHIFRIHGTKTD
ncbi:GNAT family N-acetyltransferase [uncultured Croceitalea sp.]|uniref:GNAT family N-acetyltransferase n=1 Tax=uncultured Croceitalea sp. TaxID=1798908 RepID=UPI0033058E3A